MRMPPFSTPGRFWRGNLHTHSNLSDGALTPEQVVDGLQARGLRFPRSCPTISSRASTGRSPTRARFRSNNFTTLIGAEVHAMAHGRRRTLAHPRRPACRSISPPPTPDETGPQLAARARAAGAFVAIAHPAWSQLTIERRARAGRRARGRDLQSRLRGRDRSRRRLLSARPVLNEGRRLTADRHRRRAFPPRRSTTPSAASSRSRRKASIPRRCSRR